MTPQALPYCFACTAARLQKGRRIWCMTNGREVGPTDCCGQFSSFASAKSDQVEFEPLRGVDPVPLPLQQ